MREPVVPQFDAETYLMWEGRQRERFELHHGFVFAFAGGTIDHDRVAHNARVALDRLYSEPCRAFGSDVKVQVDARTFFYPDAGVVCGNITGSETWIDTPRVIVEVLSPATRAYDLAEKRTAYHGIPSLHAYLVVHTDIRRIDLDLRDADGTWRTSFSDADPLPLGDGHIALDELYARTSLSEII